MPIERFSDSSPIFFEPEESTEIARYMSIAKFLSLLKDQQVFFCRIDKVEDKFEGTMPRMSIKHLTEWYKYLRSSKSFFKEMTDEEIEKKVQEDIVFRNKLKSLNCINCWNEFEEESYALWKIYSNINQGIMIKSSFKQIIKAFENAKEKIYCSRIEYIDYEKDKINTSNTMPPLVHKHKAYAYENEIRLIHEVSNQNWIHDWSEEKFENGVKIKVDIKELINEIIISPFSPNWFVELIDDILEKYGIESKLTKSKLS